MTTSPAPVRLTIEGGIAVLTLDSPASRNALSSAMVTAIGDAIAEAEAAAVRALVITHAPPVFCAGADMKERAAGITDSGPMSAMFARIMAFPAPVIAVATGPVRAGGVGIIAGCDLSVVDASVDFAFTEVRLGVAPAAISVPILRRVAPSALAAAYLTGERFDAAAALRMGLVTHVADDAATLWRTVEDLVNGILAGEAEAVAITKQVLWGLGAMPADEQQASATELSSRLFASPAGQEGMNSFLEKRRPVWAPTERWSMPDAPSTSG